MQHRAGDGRYAAFKTLPVDGVSKVICEFKKLNTRESRAAFADHWIGRWAQDFDEAWPVLYELLKIIEEDELYKDPRRVGPQAPGFPKETHGQQSSYADFAAYFTDRVRQPLDRWAELERTYQYAQRYAPEIFKLPYPEAQQLQKHGGDRKSEAFQQTQDQARNTRLKPLGASDTAARVRARLERDGKTELLTKVDRGEISAHKAAIQANYRQPIIQHAPTIQGFLKAAHSHLSPEQRLELKEAL
jgi:hypothetical protein